MMAAPKVLTVWLDSFYGRGPSAGPSNEAGIFGDGLLASIGIDELHLPMEAAAYPDRLAEFVYSKGHIDAIFVIPFEGVETWLSPIAKANNAPVIVWWCDNWRQAFQHEWLAAGLMDVAVTTDAINADELRDFGCERVALSNWGCRPDTWPLHPPILQPQRAASFAGLMYGDRRTRLQAIAAAGSIDIITHDTQTGVLSIEAYHRFIASYAFSLCLTQSSHGRQQMKSRLFEAALHGAVLVTEQTPNLKDYWTEDECIVYATPEEAQTKMAALVNGDAAAYLAMTGRAFERALREHTMQHRMVAVLAEAGIAASVPDFTRLLADDIDEAAV